MSIWTSDIVLGCFFDIGGCAMEHRRGSAHVWWGRSAALHPAKREEVLFQHHRSVMLVEVQNSSV